MTIDQEFMNDWLVMEKNDDLALDDDTVQHSELHLDESGDTIEGLSDEQRRARRVDLCGRVHVNSFNIKYGILTTVIYYCHEFRVCPTCRKMRIRDVSEQISVMACNSGGSLMYSLLDETSSKALREKLNKENYKCYPTADNRFLVIFDPKAEGKEVNPADYGAKEFSSNILKIESAENIAITPKGKCISGNIAKRYEEKRKAAPAPSEEKPVTVYVEELHTDQSDSEPIWKEAWHKALADSRDMDPQDEDDLQKCINRRLSLFKTHYLKGGGRILFIITKKMTVRMSHVNWKMFVNKLDLSEPADFTPEFRRKVA